MKEYIEKYPDGKINIDYEKGVLRSNAQSLKSFARMFPLSNINEAISIDDNEVIIIDSIYDIKVDDRKMTTYKRRNNNQK